MTVEELIEELKKLDPKLEVMVVGCYASTGGISAVRVDEDWQSKEIVAFLESDICSG